MADHQNGQQRAEKEGENPLKNACLEEGFGIAEMRNATTPR
jgi:hypothetical protein